MLSKNYSFLSKLIIILLILLSVSSAKMSIAEASEINKIEFSEQGLAMLKSMEGFSKFPYWDCSQYSVGYGTRCPKEKIEQWKTTGISDIEATELLLDYVRAFEKSLNLFNDVWNLHLSQQEFDALLLFSYNCGTAWMSNDSMFRSALVNRQSEAEFIFAFGKWSNINGYPSKGLIRRRLAEANVFFNGVYKTTIPQKYSYTLFSFNNSIQVQCYLTAEESDIKYKNNENGFWSTIDGKKITKLNNTTNQKTLIWKQHEEQNIEKPPIATVVVSSYNLNIRSGPGIDYPIVSSSSNGDSFPISKLQEKDGYLWGKTPIGWIALQYTNYDFSTKGNDNQLTQEESKKEDFDSTQKENEQSQETKTIRGVIKADILNIRKKPDIKSNRVGIFTYGDVVNIESQKENDLVWGKTEKGWIAMKYVELESEKTEDQKDSIENEEINHVQQQKPESENDTVVSAPTPQDKEELNSTVSVAIQSSGTVNIRKEPSLQSEIVGFYYGGSIIQANLIESQSEWIKTTKGFVCKQYVKEVATNHNVKKVNADGLRIRSSPTINAPAIGTLKNGDRVFVESCQEHDGRQWAKISCGWVAAEYLLEEKN